MEQFKKYILQTYPHFVFDDTNTPVIENLISAKRGILLIGDYGTGKTTIMRAFCSMVNIKMASVREICFEYQKSGAAGIEKYYQDTERDFKYRYFPMCIDDLGTEPRAINYFGTSDDVISNLLYLRYEALSIRPDLTGRAITFATSNLSVKMLEERYGTRLYDRFRDMFDIVVMKGKSRRK